MRSCSDSIAQLAAALAKAQMELVNPVKSLTAVIDRWGIGQEGQSYRYAPLSAGLEIVRKTLCKHELAVIQSTHLDPESGLVLLTTTLAHGSGEWVAASWPVCRAADMTNPKLMGAALTYARRYGLFTLVGLAGEDDLDAPELPGPAGAANRPAETTNGSGGEHAAPDNGPLERSAVVVAGRGTRRNPTIEDACGPLLGSEERRAKQLLRTALSISAGALDPVAELAAVKDPDGLIAWAAKVMPLRNRMAETARSALDAAFLAKAETVGADPELLLAFAPRQQAKNRRKRQKHKTNVAPAQAAL